MQETDLKYFMALRQKVAETLGQRRAISSVLTEEWKGQDILNFQEDLEEQLQQRVSEKWCYTHLKANQKKVPRIDMLNILSRYAGYRDWHDFREAQGHRHNTERPSDSKMTRIRWVIFIIALLLVVSTLIFALMTPRSTYRFCFIDADRRVPITSARIDIILLYPGESPVHMNADSNACFELETDRATIQFVVKTPYYKSDTITRIMHKAEQHENVELRPNDYALMIHLFSTSKIEDWKKRRTQLDRMLADNIQVYQIYEDEQLGMELYNKWEFINKLTMPLKSLENIEVIETLYVGEQISTLRFRQRQPKDPNSNE